MLLLLMLLTWKLRLSPIVGQRFRFYPANPAKLNGHTHHLANLQLRGCRCNLYNRFSGFLGQAFSICCHVCGLGADSGSLVVAGLGLGHLVGIIFVERVAQAIDEIWGGSPSDFRVEVCTFHLTKNTIMPFELCLNRATLQVHVDGQVDREETPVTYSSMFIPLAPPQELFAWCDADRFAFSTTVPTVNRRASKQGDKQRQVQKHPGKCSQSRPRQVEPSVKSSGQHMILAGRRV